MSLLKPPLLSNLQMKHHTAFKICQHFHRFSKFTTFLNLFWAYHQCIQGLSRWYASSSGS